MITTPTLVIVGFIYHFVDASEQHINGFFLQFSVAVY